MELSDIIKNSQDKTLKDFQGLTYANILKVQGAKADIEFKKFTKSVSGNVNYPKAFDVPILAPGGFEKFEKGKTAIVAFSVSEIKLDGKESGDKSGFLSKNNCVILGVLKDSSNPLDTWSLVFGTTEIRFGPVIGITGGMEIYVAGVKVFGALSHQHAGILPVMPTPGT